MTDDRHERIRQRAHEIWEKAGRPEGAHMEHWEQAAAEIYAAGKPKKAAKKAAAAKVEKPKAAKAEKPAKAPAKANSAKPKAKA
ncbi:DUF2934 domain-containing protein [Mesorhizobium sp. M2D.F.Ca.ET.185.01.1.1]|uniref:DUF2934 domain-containing protein n=1 Tax=unclassified Mesorhizobium TaxID=325217 RepID=UPI000FCA147F|nr:MULTISPECIES: DUF2934 domain-containing protein [unclassified Mesorhizobium]TGP74870.1 DUF2934 domain-containing protein [bacterium M00.F.Ca.ET.227.01.1.1]TGP84766.1 DUF2934 domain-containing protein [bacterium M00.F.Ca.ET.221.01.1.1]TGP87822.1 DUF2934 domain-containing protein [bacterium M00.F.Ca.ET.222.01.1.1]TGT97553.1 DUF2934 domain-containing protein [bacterium M00.F.Ca.ET.163.01.1.1]TGU21871.1 DUF2934 domain-containing protein [bacterium M00.F.Ca.ET.156.01.1.1]TGU42486.1 DUF2934 doma